MLFGLHAESWQENINNWVSITHLHLSIVKTDKLTEENVNILSLLSQFIQNMEQAQNGETVSTSAKL